MPRGRGGTRRKAGAAKPAARKTASTTKPSGERKTPIRRVEPATSATFGVDDKRAQYARLVIFNHAVKTKVPGAAGKDVNSVANSVLEKAGKDLNSGNMLKGKEGIEIIQGLSQKGATDPKVAERGLTTAYAQEVRPFIMRLQLSDSFGRRGKKAAAAATEE